MTDEYVRFFIGVKSNEEKREFLPIIKQKRERKMQKLNLFFT